MEMTNVVDEEGGSQASLQNQVEILRSSSLLGSVAELRARRDAQVQPGAPCRGAAADRPDPREPSLSALAQPHVDRLLGDPTTPEWLRNLLTRWAATPAAAQPEDNETPEEAAEREEAQRRAIVRSLNDNLSLTPVSGSSVIQLAYSSTNPPLAATIVNSIAEDYISYQMTTKREDVAAVMEMMRRG